MLSQIKSFIFLTKIIYNVIAQVPSLCLLLGNADVNNDVTNNKIREKKSQRYKRYSMLQQ